MFTIALLTNKCELVQTVIRVGTPKCMGPIMRCLDFQGSIFSDFVGCLFTGGPQLGVSLYTLIKVHSTNLNEIHFAMPVSSKRH